MRHSLRSRTMPLPVRTISALAVLAGALALAVPALAATSLSVAPTVQLVNKVGVTASITVTCPSGSTGGVFGQLEQGSGKSIAIAQLSLGGTGQPGPTCDDQPHSYAISGLASPTGAPFHGGHAVLSLGASFCRFDPTTGFLCETAPTGPVGVQLKP
jgi:hypothetical protein